MRILVVHEVSYQHKPVYEFQDFAERLAARGHEVTVIDFVEHERTHETRVRVSRTGLATVHLRSIPHGNAPGLKYVEAALRHVAMLRALLAANEVDAIVLYGVAIDGVSTAWLARSFGVPVIFRAIDVYHRLRPGMGTRLMLRWGERWVYRAVSRIVASNRRLASYVATARGHGEAGITVLDHGVDVDHFSSAPWDAKLARMLGIDVEDKVIVFLGTTYAFARLEALVVLLAPYFGGERRWKWLIIGGGERDAAIAEAVRQGGWAQSVRQVGMIDYADLPRYLALGHVAVNPFAIDDVTRDIIPIKNLQYLAAGLPVVSTPLPDLVAHLPADPQAVFYAPDDDLGSLVRLLDAVASRTDQAAMRSAALDIARRHGVEATIDRLEATLRGLVEGR